MKLWHRTLALFLTCVFALSAALSGTMAWTDFSQHRTNAAEGSGPPQLGSALLQKYETGTETPVPGVEFTLYRVNSDGTAAPVRSFVTGADGQILASDLQPGEYYWQETRTAQGFLPEIEDGQTKKYFFSLPGEEEGPVKITAYNTRREGSLALTKLVKNADNSPLTQAQKDMLFEFTVTFLGETQKVYLKSGETKEFDLPVGTHYVITETTVPGYVTTSENHAADVPDGGITAAFTNTYTPSPHDDDKGHLTVTKTVTGEGADPDLDFEFTADIGGETEHFTLKHGQSKTFVDIPLGTEYIVTEAGVPEYYTPNQQRYSGAITAPGVTVTLPFVNHYEGENPPDLPGSLDITKAVAGPGASHDKAFAFTVTFEGEGAPASPQTFTLKHGEKRTFEDIPRGTVYTVTEQAEEDYRADFTSASGTISWNQAAVVNFVNRTRSEPRENKWLVVTKRVLGNPPAADSEKLFRFTLTVNGTEYEFDLKPGESSDTFVVYPGDVYSLVEDDYTADGYTQSGVINGSGAVGEDDIEIIQSNTWVGPEFIDIEGEKTWQAPAGTQRPESVTILLKNGNVTVRTAITGQSGAWRYGFTNLPKHDALGNVIPYAVEEVRIPGWRPAVTGYDIKNIHQPPLEDAAIEVEKAVTGTPPAAIAFKFTLTAINGAPMPESGEITITGAGKASYGKITYTMPGVYIYTLTEVDGKAANWSYDASVYTLTVTVTEDDDGQFKAEKALTKAGASAEKAIFTNSYDESGETISVKVTKVWQGEGDHPQSVQIRLYKDGTLHDTATLSSANSWARTWSGLPKGHAWTVDEIDVPEGYTKTVSGDAVNGFTVTNTKKDSSGNGKITVTKTVAGGGADVTKEFTFTAVVGGVEQTFKLKHGQSKTFDNLPVGTEYIITEQAPEGWTAAPREYRGTILSGATITLPFVNHYEGDNPPDLPGNLEIVKTVAGQGDPAKEFTLEITFTGTGAPQSPQTFTLKAGEKKIFTDIPRGVAYTVRETDAGGYNPDFTTASGAIIAGQTVTVNFINRAPAGPGDETTSVKVTKIWKGEDANRPTSIAVQLYRDSAADGVPVLLSEQNKWTYTWTELEKGPAWTVNEVNVPMGYVKAVTGDAANGFVVTNTKQPGPPDDDDEITIAGRKTWNHGANPEAKRPEHIILLVKADGAITLQKRISAAENWQWAFKFPKYDGEGREIKYTVDEAQAEGYIKTVDGFSLINTFITLPGTDPNEPGTPGKPVLPRTDDPGNLTLWLTLMGLSLGGLAAVIVIARRRKKSLEEDFRHGLL